MIVITLIPASAATGAAADIRSHLDGRNGSRSPECSDTVHWALFVHATDARDSPLATAESVEMTQDEPTVARTENRASAVWAEAGALEKACGAKAMPIRKGSKSKRSRWRVMPTRLRP